jgi:hypothetical protein
MSDVTDIDNIPCRKVIDDVLKGHGESLIEFLNGSKQCILVDLIQIMIIIPVSPIKGQLLLIM